MGLELRARKISDVILVDLVGRLDCLAPALSPQIGDFVALGERHFVINLSDLDYLDAAGLGQLVKAATCVMKNGGTIALLRPKERIRKLFAISQLDKVFEIFWTEHQALARAGFQGSAKSSCTAAAHRWLAPLEYSD